MSGDILGLIDDLIGRMVDVTDHNGTTRRGRLLGYREQGFTIELEEPVAGSARWYYEWGGYRTIQGVQP